MLKTIVFIFLIATIYSCQDKKVSINTKPLGLTRVHVSASGYTATVDGVTTGRHGFDHYVFVEGYDDQAWDNPLVESGDKYIDTCKTDLPIWSITFCKPFDFIDYGDSRADDELQDHAIMDITYGLKTSQKKYRDIESITFWYDGKARNVWLLTAGREQEEKRLDSIENYKKDQKIQNNR